MMQAANRLQTALRRGSSGRSFGAWQMLPGTNISRLIARAGYDWICVDTEHGNIDDSAMHEAVGAIAGCGVSPVVRVPANQGWMIKRALDAGAHGIIVPLLQTANDAIEIVKAAKFPPQGRRGFGSPFPMGAFGDQTFTEYLQQANDSIVTIIQIETQEALQNVEAIAKVPGVDVLFIGPFDLGNNIGHPILNGCIDEALKGAIARIHQVAIKSHKQTGIYCTTGEEAKYYADQGFHMISVIGDVAALQVHLGQSLNTARGSD